MAQGHMGAIRVGFVLHVMQVAGAEMLVAEIIRRLGPAIEPVVLCLDGVGALGETMRGEGVTVVNLERRPGFDTNLPRRLAAEIDRRHLQVLHAHQYTPFFYSALAKLWCSTRVHLMFTEHGRHYPDVVSVKRRLINRFVLSRFADEVNGVAGFSVKSLADNDGFGHMPLNVIPNGIDPERYGISTREESKRRLGLDPTRRYVSCVARFHPIKDHAMLLAAFSQVAPAVRDVDLLLAGDGPLRATLMAQARDLGIEQRVHFMGVRKDVPDVLRASDAFALVSICEAASITLLEAMASEVPVVVTNVGGNPELVEHEQQGLLVPRGDAAATAGALTRVLTDSALAARMGRAGRRRVLKQFRLDDTVHTYLERYQLAVDALQSGRRHEHEEAA